MRLREWIRSGEIQCPCSNAERGFGVAVDRVGAQVLVYAGATAHRGDCAWSRSVAKIYELERAE